MAFSSLPVKELPSFASYRVALRRGFLRVSFSWLLIGSFESDSQSGASVRRALESCRVFTLYFFFLVGLVRVAFQGDSIEFTEPGS